MSYKFTNVFNVMIDPNAIKQTCSDLPLLQIPSISVLNPSPELTDTVKACPLDK